MISVLLGAHSEIAYENDFFISSEPRLSLRKDRG
jgi:hypothetical protein